MFSRFCLWDIISQALWSLISLRMHISYLIVTIQEYIWFAIMDSHSSSIWSLSMSILFLWLLVFGLWVSNSFMNIMLSPRLFRWVSDFYIAALMYSLKPSGINIYCLSVVRASVVEYLTSLTAWPGSKMKLVSLLSIALICSNIHDMESYRQPSSSLWLLWFLRH